ncbi:DUF4251 domain-containing protein [Chitinophaga agrisoli]|uniref:DUF4251 domain-containing protein n=1 Tax=Chitinophaga agrisoli TaxID=2607653 RepID=A0A5B2VK24_9BACT|nr:DUF4251 domain-containing protein [Chitinophaga agrisoli]KAA2239325.1 DUF4251 domain-containing protein [Chitinophaga agrisoli]
MRKQMNGMLCLLLAILCYGPLSAQDNKKPVIKDLIAAQEYVFKAQMALPMGGRSRQLTSDYDVKVAKDSVISYLPYFGRAYTAPLDPTQGGIQFTSRQFDYKVTPGKKGGWTILLSPKDANDVRQLSFMISEDGYGTLNVTSNNRQPIMFNGYVTARPPRKNK